MIVHLMQNTVLKWVTGKRRAAFLSKIGIDARKCLHANRIERPRLPNELYQ